MFTNFLFIISLNFADLIDFVDQNVPLILS